VSAADRSVTVDHGGRGGDVTYTDASGSLRFAWEVTGTGYEIFVPTRADWEAQTGLAAAVRDDTLRLLAEAFIEARARGGTYTVVDAPYAAIDIRW
jgi:hypothetical protein